MTSHDERGGRPLSAIVADLHYLELGCPNPALTAAFYQRALGFQLKQIGGVIIASGCGRHLAFVEGGSNTLVTTGYAVPDEAELDRLRDRIRVAGSNHKECVSPFFDTAIEVVDPDCNRFVFGVRKACVGVAMGSSNSLEARLQHVVIASRSPEKIVEYFTGVLGFTLSDDVVDEVGDVRTSFLRSSREHHSFAVFKAPENRFDHHCYETIDWNMIRDWCDHMGQERIRVQWGPGRHGPGNNLFMFIHDPDGNWVEISAELEIVGHDRPKGVWPHEQHTLNSWGQGLLRS